MATPTVLEQKAKQVKVLDQVTQDLLASFEAKDRKRRNWTTMAFCALLLAISIGIYYQFDLAAQNKRHIDCIVKLLATPTQTGQTRHIVNLSSCQIKVSG